MQHFVFGILCLIWGFSWVAIKLTLEGFPPFTGAGLRFFIAVPCLLLYALWRRIGMKIPRESIGLLLLTSFLIYAFDYGLIYWGEQFLTAGGTAILFATFPLFTGLFSRIFIPDERLEARLLIGLVIGFLGVFATFADELTKSAGDGPVHLATLAVILGAAGGGLSTVLIKRDLMNLHPVALSLWQMILGSSGLLAWGAWRGELGQVAPNRGSVLAVLYLGVVASALAFTLYYWLLGRVRAVSISTMIYVTPMVALLADWVIYRGEIGLRTILGMALVFLGVGTVDFPRYRAWIRDWRPARAREGN